MCDKWSHEQGDLLHLQLGDLVVVAGWRRPQQEQDLFNETLTAWCLQATESGRRLLLVGDWNLTPWETPLVDLGLSVFAPSHNGQYIPSRWKGNRPIDFAATNDATVSVRPIFRDERISDHKILQLDLETSFERSCHHSLVPTLCLAKPAAVSLEEWRQALARAFEGLVVDWALDVEAQWAQLCDVIEACCLHAFDLVKRSAAHISQRVRPKGSLPAVREECLQDARQPDAEGAHIRSLNRFLGRLQEVMRGDYLPEATRDVIHNLRQQRRRHGLSEWKQRVKLGGRAAIRWLQNKSCMLPPTRDGEVHVSATLPDSLRLSVLFGAACGAEQSLTLW